MPAALLVTVYYMYWTQKHKYEVRNLIKQMQKDLNEDEDYRQIIIKSYHQLLTILSRYGFIKTNTQTVREFTDVMSRALPIPVNTVKLLTSLFEIARYSGIKPKIVDEFGMEMIDGSYNIWCVEAINNLHQVEHELNAGLKEGKVSRFTNIFGMRRAK
jgi:NADH/NAD ratio-sensing transcriptional regulator Rex